MKRLFYFLIVLSCTLWSCGGDNDVDDPNNPDNPDNPTNVVLDISTTDLTFEAKGGQKEFTIYCNSDWTITNNSNWCKTDVINGNGDKTITVTADPYSETEDQNTNLTIKAGDKTKVLTITQKHGDAIILTKDKFDVPQEGENITIEVKSNIEYQVSIPYKYQSWIKEAVKSKAVTTKNFSFTISANEDFDKREGYIVFSGNSLKDTVYVYQPANIKTLILTKNSYSISSEGKTIEIELKSNINYDIIIPDSVSSWIKKIQTKAIRTDKINLKIESNTKYDNRQAIVIFKDKDSSLADTLKINQVQKNAIILTQKQYQAKATGEDLTVELNSNIEYDVIIPQDAISWISQIKTKALTTDILKFHIEANLESNKRSTKILFKAKNSNHSDTLQITQLANRAISIAKQEYNLSSTATNIFVEVTTNIDFKTIIPTNAQSWIKLIQTESTQKNSLHFSISANDNYEKRSAKVKIVDNTDDKNYIECTINQAQRDTIIIKNKIFELSADGGEINVNIKTNVLYKTIIQVDAQSWIQQIQNKGLTSENLNFKIFPNISTQDRTGKIILYDKDTNLSDTILVNQMAIGSYKGDITLTSIEALQDFKKKGYKKIYGNLTIQQIHYSIPTLSYLDNILEQINGDLILKCKDLTILDGLYGLKYIGGNLIIYDCGIESFEGLNNLKEIGKNFKLLGENSTETSSFNSLKSFEGLGNLEMIGNDFEIYGKNSSSFNKLISFEGLNRLSSVNGSLRLYGNSSKLFNSLNSFEGLENLASIGGNFELNATSSFEKLASFKGLNKLNCIGKGFKLNSSFNALSSFEGLNNLVLIESFEIFGNFPLLKNFKGLDKLTTITKSFKSPYHITNSFLNSLSSFEGLENLVLIGENFELNLKSLTTFNGLNNLKEIGGNFRLYTQTSAGTVPSFSYLTSFIGLENLKYIKGDFEIYGDVSSIQGSSAFQNLTSFQGLDNLEEIGGNFILHGESYGYSFAFPSLTSFKGLGKLNSINGDLILYSSAKQGSKSFPSLASFEGLKNLEKVYGDIDIYSYVSYELDAYYSKNSSSLQVLTSFNGLENLQLINGNFKVCSEYGKGSTISLTSFLNLQGLNKLHTIGQHFILKQINSINSFAGLENLKNIGSNLTVSNCENLNSIDALFTLNSVKNISITNCTKLYDFCVLKSLLENFDGDFYTNNNGYIATKYQILNGECSKQPE